MPPIHFEVWFSIPTVVGKTGFLWRIIGGTLQPGQVLGSDDPAFEFIGPAIGIAAEVDGAATFPELRPLLLAAGGSLRERGYCFIGCLGGEQECSFYGICCTRWRKRKMVGRGFLYGPGLLPGAPEKIGCGVKRMANG